MPNNQGFPRTYPAILKRQPWQVTLIKIRRHKEQQTMNYYIFDEIKKDKLGCYWGYKNSSFCEVFPLSSEDTEEELAAAGFAKCDAPETETFVVEESSIKWNAEGTEWELR